MYLANKARYDTMKYNRCGASGLLIGNTQFSPEERRRIEHILS